MLPAIEPCLLPVGVLDAVGDLIFQLPVLVEDESAGAKLILSDDSYGDEEGDQKDDSGSIEALAKEFNGERWDADNSAWK